MHALWVRGFVGCFFCKTVIPLVGQLALVETVGALAFVVATPCSFASELSKVRAGGVLLCMVFSPVEFVAQATYN